jgi:hypothetical protein
MCDRQNRPVTSPLLTVRLFVGTVAMPESVSTRNAADAIIPHGIAPIFLAFPLSVASLCDSMSLRFFHFR